MSTYAEMDRIRKLARPLYIELRALGIDVRAHADPDDPTGYLVEVSGLESLSPSHGDRLVRRVEEAKPGLMRILMMGKWDEELAAVRGEGGVA